MASKDSLTLAHVESDLTVGLALNGTLISTLSKSMVKNDLIKALSVIILRGCESFNIKGNLTEGQALLLAIDFTELYKHETIEDVMLMFRLVRQGVIGGKVWRIDSQIILGEWMPAYLDLKSEEREKRVEKTKNKPVELEDETDIPDATQKKIDELKKKLSTPPEKIKPKVVGTLNEFLKNLPETCKHLTNDELIIETKRAINLNAKEAEQIYNNEKKRRKI